MLEHGCLDMRGDTDVHDTPKPVEDRFLSIMRHRMHTLPAWRPRP